MTFWQAFIIIAAVVLGLPIVLAIILRVFEIAYEVLLWLTNG